MPKAAHERKHQNGKRWTSRAESADPLAKARPNCHPQRLEECNHDTFGPIPPRRLSLVHHRRQYLRFDYLLEGLAHDKMHERVRGRWRSRNGRARIGSSNGSGGQQQNGAATVQPESRRGPHQRARTALPRSQHREGKDESRIRRNTASVQKLCPLCGELPQVVPDWLSKPFVER